jgi:hypothetical protein
MSGNCPAHMSGGGGGLKFSKVFLINFLAKSGNSKNFSVVIMFACHLHKSSGMCLHLAQKNMSQLPAGPEQYFI